MFEFINVIIIIIVYGGILLVFGSYAISRGIEEFKEWNNSEDDTTEQHTFLM